MSVRDRYLWLLKNTLNRVTTRAARNGRGPFSLIRHVGRKSGRTFETPVVLAPVPEGFVAELTYGDGVNWYRNIVAAGGCVVVFGGEEHRIIAVETIGAAAGRAAFPPFRRALLTLLHRQEFRLLRTAG
ncbi:MAG: nitroreductase family deazaflavin-dependent oxidoreductase [Actinobacteria bacterium]|nr:nitroreductase family deazaflavin-dependent oxidoreductase [Actinomycetota bacterium]